MAGHGDDREEVERLLIRPLAERVSAEISTLVTLQVARILEESFLPRIQDLESRVETLEAAVSAHHY